MPSSTTSSTTDPEIDTTPDTAPSRPPANWTPDHVARRLVDAFRTLDRMPKEKGPRATGNHWVRHRVEWADRLAQAELPEYERREREARHNDALALRPSGADIARMDLMLERLRDLRAYDPELALVMTLWAHRSARRRSVRAICRDMGWKPPTFYYQRGRGLDFLAERLEAERVGVF